MFQAPKAPEQIVRPSWRFSQSWWKGGSSGSGATGPKPICPPTS
jgi:hypothetical protein